MRFHASCAARPGSGGFDAVLLLGPAGCGKSDLLLRLIDLGWLMVADDQVLVDEGVARAPDGLAGMIEVRGMGLFRLPFLSIAPLRLVARLGGQGARLPEPRWHDPLGLPEIILDAAQASAPVRVAMALDAVTGKVANMVGAFAA
jgi:HPr kinase/phosphorylase